MKYILLFSLLFFSAQVHSQTATYCIYLLSGDVTVAAASKKPEKVKLNQFLYDNQVLTIGNRSQVTLVTKDSRYLVLKTAGNYKVNELSKELINNPSGVTGKYIKLLWKDLVAPADNFSTFKKKSKAGVMGGVMRGEDCGNLIFPVPNLHSAEEEMQFTWHQTVNQPDYTLYIFDDQMNELVKKTVKDTQAIIKFTEELKGKTGKFYWNVKSNNPGSCEDDPIPFDIVNKEEEEKAGPSLTAFAENKDIFSQMAIIEKLEKDHWIYRASAFFNKLVQDNPGNMMLSNSYAMFLLKYGFNREAEMVYNAGNK